MPPVELDDECGRGQALPVIDEAAPARIAPHMSVRAILAAYPATAAVFDRHGLMGCGGEEGPQEPLELFAHAHHVDVGALLAELRAAAPAPSSYRRFIATSLGFALTFGATLGALLLATITLPHGFLGRLTVDGA